jgi:hypothetical protein
MIKINVFPMSGDLVKIHEFYMAFRPNINDIFTLLDIRYKVDLCEWKDTHEFNVYVWIIP